MQGPTYPTAREAAPALHALFAEHTEDARRRGDASIATVPDADTIEAIISAAFWASLRREERYVPRISLAFAAPHETAHPLLLERPLPLEPGALTRVAPAVEHAGIHLGVWFDPASRESSSGRLSVWGTTRSIRATCFVLEVSAPGLLVIKHHRGEGSGKFVNLAVLEGDQIKLVDEGASAYEGPAWLTPLFGGDSLTSRTGSVNALVQLAASMRGHGRGGLLLVVSPGDDFWRESMARPIPYAVSPAYSELAVLWRERLGRDQRPEWQEALARAVLGVAGLTAVDGAVVMTSDYEVLAFGAKIARRKGSPQVEQVVVTEPIVGASTVRVDPAQLGGTRHLSAAQFVHDQREAAALVASQDGRFTVFTWSARETLVHAHRVEALLL